MRANEGCREFWNYGSTTILRAFQNRSNRWLKVLDVFVKCSILENDCTCAHCFTSEHEGWLKVEGCIKVFLLENRTVIETVRQCRVPSRDLQRFNFRCLVVPM